MSIYELTRLVEGVLIRYVCDVAAVYGRQAVKQGGKGCFDLLVAFKTYH